VTENSLKGSIRSGALLAWRRKPMACEILCFIWNWTVDKERKKERKKTKRELYQRNIISLKNWHV